MKWKYWLPKYNSWVPKEVLLEHGFDKLIQKFDDHEASREGLGYRELTPSVIRKHFEDVGLDGILLIIPNGIIIWWSISQSGYCWCYVE